MLFRAIKFKDYPRLQYLLEQLGYPATKADIQKRFEVLCTMNGYEAFVAEENEELVGFVGFIKQYSFESDGPFVRVQALVVDEKFRNRGIASQLMAMVEQWAHEENCHSIILNSGNRSEREAAHAFYQQKGFVSKSTGFVKKLS